MKVFSAFLRVLCGLIAALLTLASALLLAADICISHGDDYADAVLTDEFYGAVLSAREERLAALGSAVDVDEALMERFASEELCKSLAADYVRALFSDLFHGTDKVGDLRFSSPELLDYLKADFAPYDFTDSGFKSSDAAAEAAYNQICGSISASVAFLPNKVASFIDEAAEVISLLDLAASLWILPLAVAVLFYALLLLAGRREGLRWRAFGSASAFWASAVLFFVPVLILYFGSNGERLDLDKNVLYYFLSGVVDGVRRLCLVFGAVYFGVGSVSLAVTGLWATAADRAEEA